MYFIKAIETIGHQPSFSNRGFAQHLLPAHENVMHPDYKQYINAVTLRRMSNILRMAVACASETLVQSSAEKADAIIVGTGLGCLHDTEKFLSNAILIKDSLLPPTSFIQSTHNTMAGQISLAMSNHCYNMTHTQNMLSFEHAVADAMMFLDENGGNVLLGSADEYIPQLDAVLEYFKLNDVMPTSGVSFLTVSKSETIGVKALLKAIDTFFGERISQNYVTNFLLKHQLTNAAVDLVLCSGKGSEEFLSNAGFGEVINFEKYTGRYSTSSAFALHLAVDLLSEEKNIFAGKKFQKEIKTVLICNMLHGKATGLILVQKYET